ncbi:MAG: CopD family protein [Actinomycetota bacterium]|nr:CopD family protein [Acidimicrobiales bacterium]
MPHRHTTQGPTIMLAMVRDTGYNLVLVVHILAVVVAFAPAFVHPFLVRQTRSHDLADRFQIISLMQENGQRIYAPALAAAGLLGFTLTGMSDQLYQLSQLWLWLSAGCWLAMNGLLHGLILKAEKQMANGDTSAQKRAEIGSGVLSLLFILTLILMIFKPGF